MSLDPARLLATARRLTSPKAKGAPSQAQLRRAVSTAYYSVFHAAIREAADTLVGKTKRSTKAYVLIYRAFDHRRMREICGAVDKPNLSPKTQNALGWAHTPQPLRDFANTFVDLQHQRHWADYDPTEKISQSDAIGLVNQAEFAITQLRSASAADRTVFLVYLLTSVRD